MIERLHPRRIKSYVTRAGRVSVAQERALLEQGPRFMLAYEDRPLDYQSVFGRIAPTVLEIGFGMGETTSEIAAGRPDVNFIGIEVHTPGVGALLKEIAARNLSNIRIVQHDAVEVIERMIPAATLAGVHLFFPDPWHKARHHKRRLVQAGFIADLSLRLVAGGYLHCATDWQDYADQMMSVLEDEPRLQNTVAGFASAVNPLVTRPRTKFQERGIRLGHAIRDLVFIRRC